MPFREIVMQTGGTDADGNSEGGEHFEMSVVFKGRRLKWSASVKIIFLQFLANGAAFLMVFTPKTRAIN